MIEATLAALATGESEALSVPAIAAAAGVSPSTVYRRWPDKADLITDALATIADRVVPFTPADTLRDDLIRFAEDLATGLSSPAARALARNLLARETSAADEVRQRFWERRFRASKELVDRAKERGELPPAVSHVDLLERVAAPIWMRALVTGLPIDGDWIRRLVDDTVAGLTPPAAGPPPTGRKPDI